MKPNILYYGHGSFRFVSKKGIVIYVDPYIPGDYSMPADVILCTRDDSKTVDMTLVEQNKECLTITASEAYNGGEYNIFGYRGVTISSYEASLNGETVEESVGYLLAFDKYKFYFTGKSELTAAMKLMNNYDITIAFYPIDEAYGMNAAEASHNADLMNVNCAAPYYNDKSTEDTKQVSDKGMDEMDYYKGVRVFELGKVEDIDPEW